MKARFEAAHRSQVQRKKIEEQRAVRFRGQRHHFALLVLAGVVVNPLEVGGFSAETRAVVNQLAIWCLWPRKRTARCSSIFFRWTWERCAASKRAFIYIPC